MKFCVLYGSMRDNRVGIRLAKYLIKKLEERGHEVQFMDAKELNLPLLNKRYLDYKGDAPEQLEAIAEAYRQADGFVIVSGEYNYSIQPGLKNLMDYFYHEYFFKPSALCVYSSGHYGGVRAGVQLIPLTWALHMVTIPSFLSIPRIQDELDENGAPIDPNLNDRANKFLNQFEWYARALKTEREKGHPQ